jgi:hypothetical protein
VSNKTTGIKRLKGYQYAILVISAVVSAFQLELQGVKIAPCLWFQPLQSGRSPAVRDE